MKATYLILQTRTPVASGTWFASRCLCVASPLPSWGSRSILGAPRGLPARRLPPLEVVMNVVARIIHKKKGNKPFSEAPMPLYQAPSKITPISLPSVVIA